MQWSRLSASQRTFTRSLYPVLPLLLALVVLPGARSQGAENALPDAPEAQLESPDAATLRNTPRNILKDQGGIWTSPFHVHSHDLVWLAPLALATGAAIATDHRTLRDVVTHDANFNNSSTDASNVHSHDLVWLAPLALATGAAIATDQ